MSRIAITHVGDAMEPEHLCAALESIADEIRKAVDGAPKPGTVCESETDAQDRDAAANWVKAHGGLDSVKEQAESSHLSLYLIHQIARACGIKPNSLGSKEAAEAVMAELDKRLMPEGMELPRFEDGGMLNRRDRFVCKDEEHVCAGWQIDDHGNVNVRLMWDDERPSNTYMCLSPSERVKRPELEVLGADGLPIKVGETVYSKSEARHIVAEVHAGKCPDDSDTPWVRYKSGGWDRAAILTHTPPETQKQTNEKGEQKMEQVSKKHHINTQERINEAALLKVPDYWGCRGGEAGICPVRIDGKTPAERYGVESCQDAMILDLLRLQRELDAAAGNGRNGRNEK